MADMPSMKYGAIWKAEEQRQQEKHSDGGRGFAFLRGAVDSSVAVWVAQ